nr:MurR/RpiR family transcriptional regulator [uncultured Clostridium sp.]
MKNNYDKFTNKEKKIAEYIIYEKEKFISLSAKEIGEKTDTSGPTVVRFAKKLGLSSLNELKIRVQANIERKVEKFEYLNGELDTKGIMYAIQDMVCSSIEKTIEVLNESELEKAIERLSKCRNINIFGIGSSSIVGQDFYHKLARIGRRVTYHVDSHLQIATSAVLNKEDIALVISYSGETREVLECAKNAKRNGCFVVAITRATVNNSLEKLADVILKIAPKEKELREGAISSMISEISIIDMLFLGIAKDDINKVEERLIDTRKAIVEFKKEK